MSTNYDLEMSTDDTLELDAIIQEWDAKSNSVIGNIQYEDSDSTVHNLTGIQTNTAIFDPQEAGKYTIPINGQELTVNVTKASAIPDTLTDNFEVALYDNKNRTLSDYYSGDISEATRVNDSTAGIEGDYYLEIQSGGTSNGISSVKGTSTTDLPWYPKPGYVWRYWVYPNTEDVHVYHGRQIEDGNRNGDGYTVFLGSTRDEFSLHKDARFGGTELASKTGLNISSSAWYEIEVSWDTNGTQTCTLFESDGNQVAQISGSDSTYTSEGIAWFANNDNNNRNLRFDNMRPTGSL